MSLSNASFFKFIHSRQNIIFLLLAVVIGVVYFIWLRFLYPIPSYYSDSFTWLGAAKTGQPISVRPVGYSKLIMFCKLFSASDLALIAAQFFSNLFVNLFLFFTFTWFFPVRKAAKIVLYVVLIVNPFYLFYSNYISSDAFFCCLTVLWFTLLIWIMHRPTWPFVLAQLVVLAALFELRYNAMFFPAIAAIAFFTAKQTVRWKIANTAFSFLLIASIALYTVYLTKSYTGTKTFSAFSGWQLANNALHILKHEPIDTTGIEDKEVKALIRYNVDFFDTTSQSFPDTLASAVYMWDPNSPLKKYIQDWPQKKKNYFLTWNALGPVYSEFGKTIILQKPVSYIKRFVLPNTTAYFFPPLEIYKTYMEEITSLPPVAVKYYHYKNNSIPAHHPGIYAFVFKPVPLIFFVVNLLLLLSSLYYGISKKYVKQPKLFNYTLLCFAALCIANFFFIVLLAPSVLRYHIFILTLSYPVLVYLFQQLFKPLAAKTVDTTQT